MTMRELREVFGQKVIDFTISKDLLCYDEIMDRDYLEERIRFYVDTQQIQIELDNTNVTCFMNCV